MRIEEMLGNVADRGSGLVEMPPKKEKLDDDVDVLVLGSEKKKDLIKKISNEPALERNKFAVLDAYKLHKDSATLVAISTDEEPKEAIEVPMIKGTKPWSYFLYGGSLSTYYAELQRYGPAYKKAAIIYWPKKYETVTHIYLTRGIVLAIY